MGFWTLFEVASMPILQVLLLSSLGAFMATDYLNLLPADARRSLNKLVFVVFTPSLIFASLAKSVTFEDIISWWFMIVNIGLTFLIGGILGWIVTKLLKPKPHLEGLIISMCSSGNLGNILLIIVPAICEEDGNPFGSKNVCSTNGLSYVSFSMALGGLYIWTYTYHLMRSSAAKYKELVEEEESSKEPNKDLEANENAYLLNGTTQHDTKSPLVSANKEAQSWKQILGFFHKIVEELLAPPTIAAIVGFIFGAVSWLKNLIIGDNAPLRVIEESIQLLGDGTIPCITLILGGNLTKGFHNAKLKAGSIIAVICVRFILLPIAGIGVVKAASRLGFLPSDPLYHFVLMLQFTVPPAMNIGTMSQLFDVAQEECSLLFLWTYLVAAIALTAWSTVYMWILS